MGLEVVTAMRFTPRAAAISSTFSLRCTASSSTHISSYCLLVCLEREWRRMS